MKKHRSIRENLAVAFLHLLGLNHIIGIASPEGVQTSFSVTNKDLSLALMALLLVTRNQLREDGKDEQIELLKRFADTVFAPEEEAA